MTDSDGRELAAVGSLLARGGVLDVHAMGVCGVGVSGVAALLAAAGHRVTGCDLEVDDEAVSWLRQRGVGVQRGHGADHLPVNCDLLVRSSAVVPDHPEVLAALERGAVVARRGVVLAALANQQESIVVAGTHGKTTTACFTAGLLRALGDDPDWCIGGSSKILGGVVSAGGRGPLVLEGDESDGTLAFYRPAILLVTNVSLDHVDHFGTLEDLEACFVSAAARTRDYLICCHDLCPPGLFASAARKISYGFDDGADLQIVGLKLRASGMELRFRFSNRDLEPIVARVSGRHNALNLAAALAIAIARGHSAAAAALALAKTAELPRRRFEEVYNHCGVRVISDYAHHPDEISALCELALLQRAERIWAVFQPHRYTRTLAFGERFAKAFKGVDELVLLPVFAASEQPLQGGTSEDLAAIFHDRRHLGGPRVRMAGSIEEAAGILVANLKKGDLALVVGAGTVGSLSALLSKKLQAGEYLPH